LASDLDSFGFKFGVGVEEGLGNDDGGSASVRGWAALKFGKGFVDHLGSQEFVESIFFLELGVGVSFRVFMVHTGDFCEVLGFGTVPRGGFVNFI